jgi:hypothetical protein
MSSAASNLIVSLPFLAKSVCPFGMVFVVRLLSVSKANPLPPSEVLQSKGTRQAVERAGDLDLLRLAAALALMIAALVLFLSMRIPRKRMS